MCNHDKILPPITMMRGKLRIIENHLYPKRGIIENAYTSFEVYLIFNIPRLGDIVFCIYPVFFFKNIPRFKLLFYFLLKNYIYRKFIWIEKKYTPNGVYFFCASITMMRNFWRIMVSYFLSRKITHHGCTQVKSYKWQINTKNDHIMVMNARIYWKSHGNGNVRKTKDQL